MSNINISCMDGLFTERCNLGCKYCFEDNKLNKDMDFEKLKEYLTNNPCMNFFPFGGEPFLKLDFHIDLLELVKTLEFPKMENGNICDGLYYIITNGTLLTDENLKKVKKYGFTLQISIDGCRVAHNKNRIYKNGRGSFDKVLEGIFKAHEYGVSIRLHGVCPRNNLKYTFRSLKFFFRLYLFLYGKEKAIEKLSEKLMFFIFEEDYTDEDVNLVIEQFYKFTKWIFDLDFLSIYDKKEAFKRFFCKEMMHTCGCGFQMRAIDPDFNVFPCHRFVCREDNEKYKGGNLFDINSVKNFELYNNLFKVKSRNFLYSANSVRAGTKESAWYYWCPATNLEVSGNPHYQSAKYNIFITEVVRAIKQMEKEYAISN